MPPSPWDLPLLSDFSHSNLECFLESVTPIVSTELLPKARFHTLNGFRQSSGKDMVECFSLSEVWKFYVEKSFYGSAVPILLNDGDTVVQYYAPSLSAIQIYTTKPSASFRFNNDSWSTEESENDMMSMSMSNNSSRTSDTTSDDTTVDHHEEPISQTMDRHGHLYIQFNETLGPYERVPLTNKINELAKDYPGLTKFKNMDLSPYSWMAVAWYPIYQIPTTKNVKELSACFLTYHTLSSPFQGLPSTIPKEEEDLGCAGSLGKKCGGGISGGGVSLSPFALATYKMYGELWLKPETPIHKERIISYQNVAHSWLKQLGFQHNDFNFFISRS